ncbi:alpha/beta fold hydrolase [Microbacterium gorillae]|uniref:alpha/beta fold hydrolase n=1 Tax=Microbacterium gorillae TaxID=1231063 RepID=UPI000B9A5B7E|nr:alpha/beta hydrolase [Microbacterium gorillae]
MADRIVERLVECVQEEALQERQEAWPRGLTGTATCSCIRPERPGLLQLAFGGRHAFYRTLHHDDERHRVPDLVCIHAAGSSPSTWDRVAATLTSAGWTVHTLHLPGHGPLPHRRASTLEQFSAALSSEISALNLAPGFVLAGHSFGAFLAVPLASALGSAVGRLVLEELPTPPQQAGEPGPARRQTPIALTAALVASRGACSYHQMRSVLRLLRNPSPGWWSAADTLKIPMTLLAGGPRSHLDQQRMADFVTNHASFAMLRTIEVGHHIHRDAPDRWLEEIAGWPTLWRT